MSETHTETTVTDEVTGVLLTTPRRHTGVIVGVAMNMTVDFAVALREQLEERFPEVRFAVVPAASSVAFEWDEPEPEGDLLW